MKNSPSNGSAHGGESSQDGSQAARRPETLSPDFELSLERHADGTALLVLAGELDLYRASEVEEALTRAIGGEPESARSESADEDQTTREAPRLVVDLRSVTFLDSTTLAVLLAASRRQHARQGELLVLVGPHTPMTALEVTGFDRLLAIKRVGDAPSESVA